MKSHTSVLIHLFLSIAVLAVFLQVQNHEFIDFDDGIYILENESINSGITIDGISWAFSRVLPERQARCG